MKIKQWLMLTYLIVMVLPIGAIAILYISLSDYNQSQDLKEYFDFQEVVSDIEIYLQDERLYTIQTKENYEEIRNLTNENLKIDLYRYDGVRLFSSIDVADTNQMQFVNLDRLYQNLNELQKKARTYTLKKPIVNEENQIVGLYEITMGRSDWVDTSNQQTTIMLVSSILFFILLYLTVLLLLHRKLHRPLHQLQNHMRAFAVGKKSTEKLAKPNDEIGVLISHFEQMKEQIEESREALRKEEKEKEYMVASLSHDLKTPLTVIRAYTEALEDSELSAGEREEYRVILNDKLDHMKQMIDDLSVYTTLQSSENMLKRVNVNGAEFFDMLLSGYDEPCAKKEISLTKEFSVAHAYILDPKQMVRVVDNIMDNSIRFTPKKGNIWLAAISTKHDLPAYLFSELYEEVNDFRKDGTVILIQNEGIGIENDQLANIFQPFFQDDASRGKGATSGLGLSIAKMIIEKHGGEIKIWSVSGKGTLIACLLKERS